MRRLIPILVILFVAVSSHAAESPAGRWTGAIALTNGLLDIEVELELRNNRWYGTIDIPSQQAEDLPLEFVDFRSTGDVTFQIAHLPGGARFDGTMKDGTIDGTYVQAGETFAFRLKRAPAK